MIEVAARQHRRADNELVDEPGASGSEVERPATQSQRVADERAGVRNGLLGRGGRDDEQVDIIGGDARGLDRGGARFGRERRGALVGRRDRAFANAGALDDPFVGGRDEVFQLAIGYATGRDS